MTAIGDSTPVKTCTKCGECKPASVEFFVKKLDGFASQCKPCLQETKRKAYASKSAEINQRRRAQRKANPEPYRAADAARYASGKKKRQKRSWDAKMQSAGKEYYQKNKERIIARQLQYQIANAASIRQRMSEYTRKRRKVDSVFALKLRVRALVGIALRSRQIHKSQTTESILGCDLESFKLHIERQFKRGMSWDRLDEIHIDHIVPLATAKTEDEVIALNHFTNLRPIWAKDNLSKGAQVTHLI